MDKIVSVSNESTLAPISIGNSNMTRDGTKTLKLIPLPYYGAESELKKGVGHGLLQEKV